MAKRSIILFSVIASTMVLSVYVPSVSAAAADERSWTALKENFMAFPEMRMGQIEKLFASLPGVRILSDSAERGEPETKPQARLFSFRANVFGGHHGRFSVSMADRFLQFEFEKGKLIHLSFSHSAGLMPVSQGASINPELEQGSQWYRFRANLDRFIGMSRSDLHRVMVGSTGLSSNSAIEEKYRLPGADVDFSFSGDLVDGFSVSYIDYPFSPPVTSQ